MIALTVYSQDRKLQALLASALRPEYQVTVAGEPDAIRQVAAHGGADVLLLDFDSNDASLEEQLAFFDSLGDVRIPVIAMTDDASRSTAMELLQRGAYDCIRRPPSLLELKVVARRAHEHALLKRELEQMRREVRQASGCDLLVGSSGRSQVVYELIRRVCDLNAFVLVTGESGTGKELVARALHNLSRRAAQPFVAVSCGAIPETLIEAELFGHEKGAYTGSAGAREGYLEAAGDGTLFLDEIGELSPSTQVKLLRVLQQREFCRLGGSRVVPLRARVVFATHRNLEEMVEAGTFRRDLYFRINVLKIQVPPLRERTEDIPPLARHFVRQYAALHEKPVAEVRPNAMELLVEYDWPGNVRELENVMQGAVILADGDSITRGELPPHIQQLAEDLPPAAGGVDSFEQHLRHYKIKLAQQAVLECNGNKSLAARKLQVSRAYLHRLIRTAPESTDAA